MDSAKATAARPRPLRHTFPLTRLRKIGPYDASRSRSRYRGEAGKGLRHLVGEPHLCGILSHAEMKDSSAVMVKHD